VEREKHWKPKFGDFFQEISIISLITYTRKTEKNSRKTLFLLSKENNTGIQKLATFSKEISETSSITL
jgi:hypothetical protein